MPLLCVVSGNSCDGVNVVYNWTEPRALALASRFVDGCGRRGRRRRRFESELRARKVIGAHNL